MPGPVPSGLVLARYEVFGLQHRWQALDACAAACRKASRVRVDIDALAFSDPFDRVAVDGLFATANGPAPFRLATFQRGAVSPLSKPFGFESPDDGLAALRVTQSVAGRQQEREIRVLGGAHAQLAPGRYLLLLSPDGSPLALEQIAVPEQVGGAVTWRDGRDLALGYVAFSVSAAA
ncbi:MAG: hypothetical protein JNN30_01655 [Rhodanobacteraceae bacterium]|nr:hypothetical protein [Rhodanobacteraceae bacterium]